MADKALVDGVHCPLAISTGRRSAQQNPLQKNQKNCQKMPNSTKKLIKRIGAAKKEKVDKYTPPNFLENLPKKL